MRASNNGIISEFNLRNFLSLVVYEKIFFQSEKITKEIFDWGQVLRMMNESHFAQFFLMKRECSFKSKFKNVFFFYCLPTGWQFILL